MSSAKKWSDILPPQSLEKACFLLKKAQAARDTGETIYPSQSLIFNALTTTPPESVKAVIVGQDPYHGEGQRGSSGVHRFETVFVDEQTASGNGGELH